MAFIKTLAPDQASGKLKKLYDESEQRAGRVANVVRLMSLNPVTLEASMKFYQTLMHSPSELSRAQREMIAVVVSKANDCFY